jgi:hypothetical protein
MGTEETEDGRDLADHDDPGLLRREPALLIGLGLALLQGLYALIGGGTLDDGFQLNPDGLLVLAPIIAALGIRQGVFSPATVAEYTERLNRRRAAEDAVAGPRR